MSCVQQKDLTPIWCLWRAITAALEHGRDAATNRCPEWTRDPTGSVKSKNQWLARGTVHGWKRTFDDPTPIPSGCKLVTLLDAATYATNLPKKEVDTAEWQAVIESLMLVAELGGPTMFARIGTMRALNGCVERVLDPSRKDQHWGRRKLAGDQ